MEERSFRGCTSPTDTLNRRAVLQRVDSGELSHLGDLFAELRVVLHRTGAEGYILVDSVNIGETGEVPDHIGSETSGRRALPPVGDGKEDANSWSKDRKIERGITVRQSAFCFYQSTMVQSFHYPRAAAIYISSSSRLPFPLPRQENEFIGILRVNGAGHRQRFLRCAIPGGIYASSSHHERRSGTRTERMGINPTPKLTEMMSQWCALA